MSASIELSAPAFTVGCPASVFDTLVRLAETAMPSEMAGLLLGHVSPDAGRVEVAAQYVLEGFEATRWSLRLPAAAWIKADWEIRRDYPGMQMVGWYHTHPGHGIFLSSQDWDLHVRKFAPDQQPWATAWVLDPIKCHWGAYFAPAAAAGPQALQLCSVQSALPYAYQPSNPSPTTKEASDG